MNQLLTMIVFVALLVPRIAFANGTESDQQKTVGLSLRGGYLAGTIGTGIDGYYRATSDFELGLTYFNGKFSKDKRHTYDDYKDETIISGAPKQQQKDPLVEGSEAEYSVQQYGLYGRYFIWHSFNSSFGLVHRRVKGSFAHDGFPFQDSPDHVTGSLEAEAIAALVQIGNRWAWDSGFTLGADWVGYTVPLAQTNKKGGAGGVESLEGDEFNNAKRAFKGATSRPLLQMLMIDIGYQF